MARRKKKLIELKVDKRNKLILYPMKKPSKMVGRYKWMYLTNNKVVARSDYHWASSAACLTAFMNFQKRLKFTTISTVPELIDNDMIVFYNIKRVETRLSR